MTQFWVVGGAHAGGRPGDAVGRKGQWFGPFSDYELAREEWQRRSRGGAKERDAGHYRIEQFDPDTPPPCTD